MITQWCSLELKSKLIAVNRAVVTLCVVTTCPIFIMFER